MVDASYLDEGYSTNESEDLYAEFHDNGQLKLFRSAPPDGPGRSVTLRLERHRAAGRLEKLEVSFEPQPEDVDESGNAAADEFDQWVRRGIRAVYDLKQGVRRCGFCGKTNEEVAVLIAGPESYICDECIGMCNTILAERANE